MTIDERCKAAEVEHCDYDIDLAEWRAPKPHGLSGCFRLRNECEQMWESVTSFLPFLDEAVLVVQPSDDCTVQLADQMASIYPTVRVEYYPFEVHPIATPGHFDSPENSVHTMMHMSNWALSRCRYSWIAKVEGDVTALRDFARARKWIDTNRDGRAYIGFAVLNVAGPGRVEFSATAPRNGGWDEAVFNNDPQWHFVRNDKWETVNHHEHRDAMRNIGWGGVHTKRCKAKHQGLREHEEWQPLTPSKLKAALKDYADAGHPWYGPPAEEYAPWID